MDSNMIWNKYQVCHNYMQQKEIVSKTDAYWNNYIGNQWKGIDGGNKRLEERLPVLNFIKPTVKYKVSTICQHTMTANFSDTRGRSEKEPIFTLLNEKFAQSWEKGKMNNNVWKLVKNAAIQGDSYLYWGEGDTNKEPQIISNTAILFGDENNNNIQEQPYIFITERLPLKQVKAMAKANGVPQETINEIKPDNETNDLLLNKREVSDKVTVVLYMDKGEDGYVRFCKATKTCIIKPFENITLTKNGNTVLGLKHYPIVSFIWERIPNSARGISEVEQLIPNQLETNKTLARRAETVKLTAFPRIAYDGNSIDNEEDLKKVGAPIRVTTGGAQSINQSIAYLNAANISSDAESLSNDLLEKTRVLAGAGDNAMGNINPERASGNAIMAVRDQSELPLNEQVSEFEQLVENVALLWIDLWVTYEPNDFVVYTENGEEHIPVEEIVDMKPSVRIDVSQDNEWTKLAEQQAVDNLLINKQITLEEYATLMPVNGPISKSKMDLILQRRTQKQAEMEQNYPPEVLEQAELEQQLN